MIDSIIDSISRFTPTPPTKKIKLLKKYIKLHVIFWFIHHTSSIFSSFFFIPFSSSSFALFLLLQLWNIFNFVISCWVKFFCYFFDFKWQFFLNSLNNNIFVLLYVMLSLEQCYSALFCGCMMVGRMRGNICVWWCVDTFFIYKIPNNI